MLLLVIGGSASGKSEYAEARALAAAGKKMFYVAAMKPFGEEAQKRIERHRRMRAGKGFETVERYTDLEGLCRERPDLAGQVVLVECLSNLTANEIFEPEGAGAASAEQAIVSGIYRLSKLAGTVIVVTADVFGEGRQTGSVESGQAIAAAGEPADAATEGRKTVAAPDESSDAAAHEPAEPADLTDLYVRILGRVNARLAQMADEVVEVVYSIPVKQKG